MTKTPTIRSATAADIPELARLRWQLYTEQGPHHEPFDEPCLVYPRRGTASLGPSVT